MASDLHAELVCAAVNRRRDESCHIVELDRVAQREALTFGINYQSRDLILDSEGAGVSISEADAVWLRRIPSEQHLRLPLESDQALQVVNNDCKGAALGLLRTHVRGKWISSIEATIRASDKIAQLQTAHESGFRVPRTLVTQSASEVRAFLAEVGAAIVKTVVGATGPMLQTVKIDDPDVFEDEQYQASPAIYQEFIGGARHIRLACFGDKSFAGVIVSKDVDWRGNLHVPVEPYHVDDDLHSQVRSVLDKLDLAMGVVDIKEDPSGELVWLEVNPQGQFAFLDGLAGTDLVEAFTDYLCAEAGQM